MESDGFNGTGVLTEGTMSLENANFWKTQEWGIEPYPNITIDLGWEKLVTGFYLRNLYFEYVKGGQSK